MLTPHGKTPISFRNLNKIIEYAENDASNKGNVEYMRRMWRDKCKYKA